MMPGDAAAVRQHREGQLAHQAQPAAAVNEADALPRPCVWPSWRAAVAYAGLVPTFEPQ